MLTKFLASEGRIYHALVFARDWLDIRQDTFLSDYLVRPRDETRSYNGLYEPSPLALMVYNGEPSKLTIFHEAVHYAQDERSGWHLRETYQGHDQRIKDRLFAMKTDHMVDDWSLSKIAYKANPFEVEAFEQSCQMLEAYHDRFPLSP